MERKNINSNGRISKISYIGKGYLKRQGSTQIINRGKHGSTKLGFVMLVRIKVSIFLKKKYGPEMCLALKDPLIALSIFACSISAGLSLNEI